MSVRQELIENEDGTWTILLSARDVIELHDMAHNVIERRATTPQERAEHIAWEASGGRSRVPMRQPAPLTRRKKDTWPSSG